MLRRSSLLLLPLLAAAAPETRFAGAVYPALQKANCRTCHVEGGVAAGTRLHFPDAGASPEEIEEFGRSLFTLINRENPEASLLFTKPTNRETHTGGKLIASGSREETDLLDWIRHMARVAPEPERALPKSAAKPAQVSMRRLTHSQYNHTVRDLLGDQTNPANHFPPEDFVNGFRNQADAQSIPALLAEAYGTAAEKLVRNAFRGGDTNGLIPCKQDAKCAGEFVRDFGLKAFRRPLAAREVERYAKLIGGQKDFMAGAQLVVEAMLQSTNFLYRVERGGGAKPYETASRLSYFLWDTMPDAGLLRAAAAGELDTHAGVEKAVRRMLADPRARQSLDEFVSQWLRFDRVLNTVKDRADFPTFNPELAAAMTEETRLLVADAVWNDRDFMTIFRSDFGFLNSDLASLYKFPAPPGEFQRVQFPADSDRAGLLGQATFLALTSKPSETSPTARGLFVREQFLCQTVPDPPPGTNSNLPPLTEAKPQTNRERLSVHLTSEACASCHKLIDPIGFGFEKFDAIGASRDKLSLTFRPGRKEKNKEPVKVELPLDTSGEVAGIPNSGFSSPKELGRVLAENPECQQCVVKQLFRFAFGRPEAPADRPVIEAAFGKFRDSQFRFRELMAAMAIALVRRTPRSAAGPPAGLFDERTNPKPAGGPAADRGVRRTTAQDTAFEQRVAPILKISCTPCHDDATHTSGLSVLSRDSLLAGGARQGASVTPGKPGDSVLIKMLRGQVTPRMPLSDQPLSEEKIDTIAAWIAGLKPESAEKPTQKWWAFEAPKKQSTATGIDHFIIKKLEEKGLTPAPPADPRTLLRRAYFGLIGVPPTPEEAKAFLNDTSPGSYSQMIDRLLADPRYGERWGRHWLDLARYADTQGFEADRENYSMWRYRDYVIDAFNKDKPYDQFVKEQLAGDEMAPKSPEARIALGFLRLGPRFQTTNQLEARQLTLDEMTGTVGSVFLGLTMRCAQCHDHKYDPIPQKDYYRMQAFFVPIEMSDIPVEFGDPAEKAKMQAARDGYSKQLSEANARLNAFQEPLLARLGDGKQVADLERILIRSDANALTPNLQDTTFTLEEKKKYLDLLGYVDGNRGGRDMGLIRRQVARYEPKAHSVQNGRNDPTKPILPVAIVRIRGEYNQLGEVVQPSFLSAITGNTEPAALTSDRFGNVNGWRMPLANWIASPENPLTARVMVNRIWQHHFGTGIAGTPSDFGKNGAKPTHPELLDYLANQFVEKKWSVKAMHRLIMNSTAYKQTSQRSSKKEEEVDPANLLLWRMNRQRLEGEVIRDSLLAVSGRLNPERGGPGVFPKLPDAMKDRMSIKNLPSWEPSDGPESRRRSIYIFQRRQLEVPFLSLLDASVFQTSCERRAVSTTALQALTLMNGDLITAEAAAFAGRVMRETGPDLSEQISHAFWLALSRVPKPAELTKAQSFMAAEGGDGLAGLCRTLLNTNEFAYVD